MKIYDCFMYFDEEVVLDLRLNILSKYVDKFIITEATYAHNGDPKKLNQTDKENLKLDPNTFEDLAEKIIL